MKRMTWLAALLPAALLLLRPEAAANGAREALAHWYYAVAPALFPFMALLPLITCPEALRACDAWLGGLMRLFRLPGAAASAVAVGMVAGSPAGCAAAGRVIRQNGLPRPKAAALAVACCGLSPAFLIGGVGAGMLGDSAAGRLLLRSQLAAQLTLLLTARAGGPVKSLPYNEAPAAPSGIGQAVGAVLSVAGYMALFGALGAALSDLAGDAMGKGLLCVMDVTSGARIVAQSPLPAHLRLALLSAVTGWGGLCVALQNLRALSNCDIPVISFFIFRACATLLSALYTLIQLRLPPIPPQIRLQPLPMAAFCACFLAIPALIRLKKQNS